MENESIAELFLREAESAEGHLEKAFRRAAHAAFMWPVEASALAAVGRSLTELPAIGPSLARRLHEWLETPPSLTKPPPIRREFLTLAKARKVLEKDPGWSRQLRGDLQMHTEWSDGAVSIGEMAAGAIERNYQYIAITDHTKGLKIAGGIDEKRLARQAREIFRVNKQLAKARPRFHHSALGRNEFITRGRRRYGSKGDAAVGPGPRMFSIPPSDGRKIRRSDILPA